MYIEEQIAQMQRQMNDMEKEIKRLRGRNTGEILTPEEFAEKFKLNKNTVYCWVREGKIKALPNLCVALCKRPQNQSFSFKNHTRSPFGPQLRVSPYVPFCTSWKSETFTGL